MVTIPGLATLIIAVLVAPEQVPTDPLNVTMVAVRATNEGRVPKHFDKELRACKPSLQPLSFDAFYHLNSAILGIPFGKETELYISAKYSLWLNPQSIDEDGRVHVKARITMAARRPEDKAINALNTTLSIVPGRPLNLGGLPLPQGELIIVLSVKP